MIDPLFNEALNNLDEGFAFNHIPSFDYVKCQDVIGTKLNGV